MQVSQGVYELPLSKLQTSKFNVRKNGALVDIDDLTTNIAKIGIKNPLVVHEYRKNNYEVVSGQRRYIAARKAGLKTVPCIIRKKMNEIDMIIESLSENLFRSEMTMTDKGKASAELLKRCKGDRKKVSEILGVHISTVQKYLEANSISPDMKKYQTQGMNYSTARTIYKKHPNNEKQRKALAEAYLNKSQREKSDFYTEIIESKENDTIEVVEKKFRKNKGSTTMKIKLPSTQSKYVESLAKEKNVNPQQIIIELIAIGVTMHKSGKVRI